MTQSYTTSRSRVLCGQECPRKRYWQYEYNQAGLLAPGQSLRLETGIAVHKMLEQSLKGEEVSPPQMHNYVPETWEFYPEGTITEHEFFLQVVGEVVIPIIAQRLLKDYYMLLTEGTHVPTLVDNLGSDVAKVNWYSREDGLLRSKQDLDRWIFSFKTTKQFSTWATFDTARIAMQNVSEAWAATADGYQDIGGTLMSWLEVGDVKENKDDGLWERTSPLVRPYWDRVSQQAFWSYRYVGEDGRGHVVPKSAERRFIGEIMPLAEWVNLLQRGEVVGQDLNATIFGPVAFKLNKTRQEEWLRQVTSEAKGEPLFAAASFITQRSLEEETVEEWLATLDRFYPQHERACRWCPFTQLCWERRYEKIGSLYKIKKVRHKIEEVVEDD